MPAVMKPEVVPPAPLEPPTETAAAAQWSVPHLQGRGCSFCPSESSALLVGSVPQLPERIGRVLGVRLPFPEKRSASAICVDCMRTIDDAERTNVLRQAMRSHFEANQDASFASENPRRGGRGALRVSSSAVAMTRSGAVTASYSAAVAAAAAEDQQSQASSCDGCGSSSTSGGGGSGGPRCAAANGEQLDATEQQQQQQEQQATLASPRIVVPKVARKRYFCSQCEKSFTAKSHYDDHVNKHSAAKKFVCGLCGKAFKFKRGLREHARDAHPGGTSSEPLYGMADGEELLAYPAGDRLAAGGICAAAPTHSGTGGGPRLVASIKIEPSSGGVGDDDYADYGDEYDDYDDECDEMATTRPMSSTLVRTSASRSSGRQESASRPPPTAASHVAAGGWQQECQPSSSASRAIVFKRRGDSSCTSPERDPTAVGARPPPTLDNGYCGGEDEEEDDDEVEDDEDDNIRVCSSNESSSENAVGRARQRRLSSRPPEEWQILAREASATARPPSTVSRILASALLPSTSYQQHRQRRKRPSPQQQPQQPPEAFQLVVFDGEASREALPPAGDSAVTFPCTLCFSRFKYKRGLVSHVKRKHCDLVEDPEERRRAVEFLQLLKDQRHTASRKRTGSFGACSTSGSQAGATRTGVTSLEETAFAAVGDSVGSVGGSDCCDDDDCDGRSATGTCSQRKSASGVLLATTVDSVGSAGASDFGDDVNGNDESDVFDGCGAPINAEAGAPARIASVAATAVSVAGSRDTRGRSSGGGRGSPTQPHWVAELRKDAHKIRPLAAATGRQPAAAGSSRDSNGTEAGRPTTVDRLSGDVEYGKGAEGASVSSSAGASVSSSVGAVKSVNNSGDPVPPQAGGKRRRLCEDLSTVRA